MKPYISRETARDYLREQGVPIGDKSLKDHANRGSGPRYAIINGRALYKPAWLDEWLADQASRPVGRDRTDIAAQSSLAVNAEKVSE